MKQFISSVFIVLLLAGHSNAQTKGYDDIGKFGTYGMPWALVWQDKKMVFINKKGEEVVPAEYDDIGKFGSHGSSWSLVKKGDQCGFINKTGEVVVPVEYDDPDDIEREKP